MKSRFQLLGFILILLSSCASGGRGPALGNEYVSSSDYEFSEVSRSSSSETRNDERMIAYSVTLELSVKNTEDTKTLLQEQIKSNSGYVVRESDSYITTRIPSENMDNFVNFAKTLGKIENESKTGNDITDQYRDNVLRLDSLKNVRNRYLALLDQAKAVSDILSIEKELERVNSQIEMLEGRIKYAEQSAAYSNITVRFKEKAKPGPVSWIFYGLYRGVKWLFVWG